MFFFFDIFSKDLFYKFCFFPISPILFLPFHMIIFFMSLLFVFYPFTSCRRRSSESLCPFPNSSSIASRNTQYGNNNSRNNNNTNQFKNPQHSISKLNFLCMLNLCIEKKYHLFVTFLHSSAHSTKGHMIEILQPLKIRCNHTTLPEENTEKKMLFFLSLKFFVGILQSIWLYRCHPMKSK